MMLSAERKRRLSRSPRADNLSILAGCLVLIVYIGFLLASNYRSQVALRGAALEKMRLDVEKNAAIVSYFLAERRNDLQALVGGKEFSGYFINKDLGMSEDYGLKVNLFVIERLFRETLQEKTIYGTPIYDRLLFLDENGTPLVDISSGNGNSGDDWQNFLPAGKDDVSVFYAGAQIAFSAPYKFKGDQRGQVISTLATTSLLTPLLPHVGESLARGYRIVAADLAPTTLRDMDRPPAVYGLPENLELPTGELLFFHAAQPDAAAAEMVAFKVPVKNAPLALVFFSPVEEIYGQLSPWQLFVATGSLALIILCGVGILLWINTQNLLLKTRIDEADRQKGELVSHNSRLEHEIELRKQVEGELRLKQQQIETQTVELQKSIKAAEEANQAKNQFLAKMSHELRTPMTVIMGSVEYLKRCSTAPEREKLLEMADSSAQRLLGVIEDLLDIAKIEARKLKIETQPFSLPDCVRRALEMFAAPAGEKGLRLHWSVAPQVPDLVVGDPARLGQVLVNLVGNAVKFTRTGEVALRIVKRGGVLVFAVRDTGIGIPAEEIGKLFQPFSQVDSSLTRSYGGTGLGLAISKELVEMMGGTIEVASVAGQGSTFTFRLPLLPVKASETTETLAAAPKKSAPSLQVLLVEDDPTVRDLLTIVLQERGLHVVVAQNGREAVTLARGVDLILMDLQMPEMNGLEATRRIRELEHGQGRKTPIFALTAHVRTEDRQECLASGMDGFLGKPLDMQELGRVIETCLPV